MSANYPKHLGERQALREQILADHLARARQTAMGRSIKCGAPPEHYRGWKHASDPDGCTNDGSGCLCECHDPEPDVHAEGSAHPGGEVEG